MLADSTLLYTTVAASGWELRRARPDSGVAAPARSEPLPFDSAPGTALRETGYALGSSLRPHFWLPLVLDRGSAGTFFGVATGGTDAVERYTYAVAALASASPGRMVAAFDGVSHLFGNPSLDLSLTSDWAPVASGPDTSASQRESDAALGVTFVARRWETTASLRVAAEYEATHFVGDSGAPPACAGGCVDQIAARRVRHAGAALLHVRHGGDFTGRRGAAVGDVSPLGRAGHRSVVERAPSRDRGLRSPCRSRRDSRTRYWPCGWRRGRCPGRCRACSTWAACRRGDSPWRLGQSLGQTRDFPVRGYAEGELWGDRAIVTSVEYRVPLALIGQLSAISRSAATRCRSRCSPMQGVGGTTATPRSWRGCARWAPSWWAT